MGQLEHLSLNLSVPRGHCAVCTKEPVGNILVMDILYDNVIYNVVVCRHCLAEYAPDALKNIEEEAAEEPPGGAQRR